MGAALLVGHYPKSDIYSQSHYFQSEFDKIGVYIFVFMVKEHDEAASGGV